MSEYSILVVEDEALIAASLVHTLSSLGYKVPEPVATGEDAIHAVKTQKPDLVLMDIVLIGEMDGIVAAEKIRAIADIPIVYLTAYTDNLHLKQARLTEPYGYLVKPAQKRELHATIEMALYKHALDRKLKGSEERYRTLIVSLEEAIILQDKTGEILTWNRAAERLFGVTASEVLGHTAISRKWKTIREDGTEFPYSEHPSTHTLETGEPSKNVVMGITNASGGIFWVTINTCPLFKDGEVKPYAVVISISDITERKRAEDALRESEDLFAKAFYSGPLMLAISDVDTGRYLNINDTFTSVLGYSRDEAIGKTSVELGTISPEDRESLFLELKRTGRVAGREFRFKKKDGKSGWDLFFGEIITVSGKKRLLSLAEDITERKLMEEVLHKSELDLREAQRVSHVGSWDLNVVTGDLQWSDECYRIYGFTPQEFVPTYEKFRSIVHPEDLGFVQEQVDAALNNDKHYNIDFRFVRPDGVKGWIHCDGEVTRDEEGKPLRFFGTQIDITGRKLMEEALRKERDFAHSVVGTAQAIVLILDPEGHIVYFNPYLEEISGYSLADVKGKDWFETFLPSHIQERVRLLFRKAIGNTQTRGNVDVIITKDGRERLIEWYDKTLKGADGKIEGLLAVGQDITERKRAEEEIQLLNATLEQRVAERTVQLEKAVKDIGIERQRLYDVLETLPVYICLLTPDYHILFANRYFRETLGEPKGRRCYESLFNRTEPCETCETYTVMKTRAPHHWYWTGPNGRDYDIYDHPFIETDGSLNILEMGIDITERKQAEESVRKSLNERDLLLREIHHRVGNNLQIMLSLIRLQSRTIKDPQFLDTMGEFQNRILAMAHVHERMYHAEDISSIELSEIVTFLGTSLFKFYKVDSQHIRLNVEMKDLQITIDSAIPLSLIINELISNSIKHAFPKGTTGDITISARREADTLVLSFRDTGIGIPEELDWKRNEQSLGLRLVVILVEQLNGTIELDRTTGTAFNIVVKE